MYLRFQDAAQLGSQMAPRVPAHGMQDQDRPKFFPSSSPCCCRDLLYLDLALENVVRSAAERGSGASGRGSAALIAPLLQNLVLSVGDNEELCYCLKAWQELPGSITSGSSSSKQDALKVGCQHCCADSLHSRVSISKAC